MKLYLFTFFFIITISVFCYSIIHLFSYAYFYSMYLFFDLYILYKLMSISCNLFFSHHSYFNFSLYVHDTVGGVVMEVCVCVSGRCRGWVVNMFMGWGVGFKLMSVNSVF